MKELNSQQLILLALLVSFVTSIATGIVTVTLMDQAPPPITQTINRVVEKTIERVVPGESKTTTVVKEVPVFVTEEQLIVEAVNKAIDGVVQIANSSGVYLGSGFLVNGRGMVVTSPALFLNANADESYRVLLEGGESVLAKRFSQETLPQVVLLKLDKDVGQDAISELSLVGDLVAPGQTVVALGRISGGSIHVSGGIVSSVFDFTTEATSTTPAVTSTLVRTNAVNVDNIGGPLLNIHGEVVGLNKEAGVALAASQIQTLLDSLE